MNIKIGGYDLSFHFARKIYDLIESLCQKKAENNEEKDVYVHLNWSKHFNPSYVRRIKSIRMHRNNYGNIQDSDYLGEELIYSSHLYKNKELFVVREGDWFGGILSGGTVTIEEMEKKCRYYLIQINEEFPNGFQNLGFVFQNISYPWHENELVKIIVENKLYKHITVENSILINS